MTRTPRAAAARAITCVAALLLLALPVPARAIVARPAGRANPWWAGFELGYGGLKLTSDQERRPAQNSFAMGYRVGRQLNGSVGLGVVLGGWVLEPFRPDDAASGESVTNVLGVLRLSPGRRSPLFMEVGGGLAMYSNNHPDEWGSAGGTWTAGLGCEMRLSGRFDLVPELNYSAGRLDDVHNRVADSTGRHYRVWDARIGFLWYLGGER